MKVVLVVLACLHLVQADVDRVRYRLSSKSNYHINTDGASIPDALEQAADDQCTPIQISVVSRHGARYPATSGTKRHHALAKRLNTADLTMAFKGLTLPDLPDDKVGQLSERGAAELESIGGRIRSHFPDLLGSDYSTLSYPFESSYLQRAFQSAKAFAAGAFPDAEVDVSSKLEGEADADTILRPFDSCPRYVMEVADNATSGEWAQSKLWRDDTPMRHALRAVQQRMWPHMKMADMYALYEACAYELLTRDASETSEPLVCHGFKEPELAAMEYDADLRAWWEKGYGYKLTSVLSQMLLTEMRDEWHTAVMAKEQEVTANIKGTFRFTHAELIMPLFATLGLYNDDFRLEAGSDPEQIDHRKWNQSKICPMSANILFVLHSCKDSDPKIQVFVNEGLEKLPWCSGSLCPLSEFEDRMHTLCGDCTHAAWHSTCTQRRPEHHGEVGIVLLPGGASIPLAIGCVVIAYLFVLHWKTRPR